MEQEIKNQFSEIREEISQLSTRMDQRFEKIDQRFEKIDQRFEKIDQRFENSECLAVVASINKLTSDFQRKCLADERFQKDLYGMFETMIMELRALNNHSAAAR